TSFTPWAKRHQYRYSLLVEDQNSQWRQQERGRARPNFSVVTAHGKVKIRRRAAALLCVGGALAEDHNLLRRFRHSAEVLSPRDPAWRDRSLSGCQFLQVSRIRGFHRSPTFLLSTKG